MNNDMTALMVHIEKQIEDARSEPNQFLAQRHMVNGSDWKVLVHHTDLGTIDLKIQNRSLKYDTTN